MDFKKLIFKKQLIIVCGLGGVGKTTLSAALALRAAEEGKKSLVITVDPAKRLAQALGLKGSCTEPMEIWRGKGILYACLLDAKETFDNLIKRHAQKEMGEAILNNTLYQQLSLMLAGTQEYMAMEKLYALSHEGKYDLLIVDTPPARHAIDFLKAPMKLTGLLNDSILKLMIFPSLKMGEIGSKILGLLGRVTGGGILEDIAKLMQVSFNLLEGFAQRSGEIQKHLIGKECAFVLATAVNSGLMNDANIFREELAKLGFLLEGLLINRLPPSFGNSLDIEAALRWAKGQKDPLWEEAGSLLKAEQKNNELLRTKLKPLLDAIPYCNLFPEMPEGVSNFKDLKTLAKYI